MRIARRKVFGRTLGALLATCAVSLALASGASAHIVFMGIDGEDGGPNGHGPIGSYCTLVQNQLNNVHGTKASVPNGKLLVLGSKGFGSPPALWTAVAGCINAPVEQIGTASGIANADFSDVIMIAVVGSEYDTSGGLTQEEQDALLARAGDITNFVNAGGSLMGFNQQGLTNEYQYVGGVGSLTVAHPAQYSDISPTPAGQALGVTDALDVCCWHDTFTTVPSGFEVLAFNGATNDAAAIGTASTVSNEQCSNGVDDDGDGAVDGADSDCQVVTPENCTNGVDDDGDNLVDIDDPDCQGLEGPAGDATCVDGIDNDSDGFVDGSDPDCQGGGGGVGGKKCAGRAATIATSGNGPANVVGTPGDDVIVTGNGPDTVDGRGGDDIICTLDGDDTVRAGAGDDFIHAGRGDDSVGGQSGNDQVGGGGGNDTVNGGDGTDVARGQDGNDTLNGGGGDNDRVIGGGGSDKLAGNDGTGDSCNGGPDSGEPDKVVANHGCEHIINVP